MDNFFALRLLRDAGFSAQAARATIENIHAFLQGQPPDPDWPEVDPEPEFKALQQAVANNDWDSAANAGEKLENTFRYVNELAEPLAAAKKSVQDKDHSAATEAVARLIKAHYDWDPGAPKKTSLATVESVSPVTLKGMPDEEVTNLHHRIHQLWGQHFATTTQERAGGLVREDLWNAHEFLVTEMQRRGIHHDSPLPQRFQQATSPTQLPDQIMVVPQFVSIVGSTAAAGPNPNRDVDVLIRAERKDGKFLLHADNLDLPIRKALDPDKAGRLHFIANPQGPHAANIALYHLALVRAGPEQIQLAIAPWYTGDLPKPAMKVHTEFFSLGELWENWAAARIDAGLMIEEKLNGFRALLQKKRDSVRLTTLDEARSDHAAKFPEIIDAIRNLPGDLILDGDLAIVQNQQRWPRPSLMTLTAEKPDLPTGAQAIFTAFDILYHDKDLTSLPLQERRQHLEKIIDEHSRPHLAISQAQAVTTRAALEAAGKKLAGLPMSEGIVVKELDSPYPLARSTSAWAKVKHIVEIKAIILKTRKNKAGTYNFRAGLLPVDDRFPNRTRLNGQEYIDLGYSMNASFSARPGDIVTFQVAEIILQPNGHLAWAVATPLDIDRDRPGPYTTTQAIDLARRGRILQDTTRLATQPDEEGDTRAERAAKFWADHWHESFPKGGSGEFVYQHHWRGLSEDETHLPEAQLLETDHSIHGDLRLSFGPALWGFTCFLGETSDAQQRDLPNLPADDALEGKFKLHQPPAWLTIARQTPFVVDPGGIGSTSQKWSKFFEIDHGTWQMGVWHEHAFEIFLQGKHIKGRYIITYAPIGGRRTWLIRIPKDQTPFAQSHNLDSIIKKRKARRDRYLIWASPDQPPQLIDLTNQPSNRR